MADVSCVLADGDGVRLVDGDGYYLEVGITAPLEPPKIPTGLGYDPATGTITADWQPDATSHKIYSNDYDTEGRTGLRDELVSTEALALNTDTSYDDGALQTDEIRVYDVVAYDEVFDVESPPTRPVFAHGSEHRLAES